MIGCGGLGSGALYWLSRHVGADVLGLEQFNLFHHNGGSQDRSRIIRHYYHKDHYAQLTPHAYRAWETVEEESGMQIVHKAAGVLLAYVDTPQRATVERYAASLDLLCMDYEWLTTDELCYRYPQFWRSAK